MGTYEAPQEVMKAQFIENFEAPPPLPPKKKKQVCVCVCVKAFGTVPWYVIPSEDTLSPQYRRVHTRPATIYRYIMIQLASIQYDIYRVWSTYVNTLGHM